jgi:acyl transferase domain-containing protein
LGEHALSVFAGVMSAEAALSLVVYRARLSLEPGESMLENLRRTAKRINYSTPKAKWISTATGTQIGADEIDSDYWIENTGSAVKLEQAMQLSIAEGCTILIEIGPQSPRSALMMEGCDALWLPSLGPAEDWTTLLESLAQLYVHGVDIDWVGFDKPYQRSKVQLPKYPFQRKRHWLDALNPQGTERRSDRTLHPLLGGMLSHQE